MSCRLLELGQRLEQLDRLPREDPDQLADLVVRLLIL